MPKQNQTPTVSCNPNQLGESASHSVSQILEITGLGCTTQEEMLLQVIALRGKVDLLDNWQALRQLDTLALDKDSA